MKTLTSLLSIAFLLVLSGSVSAQLRTPPIDGSPLDMSYFPNGYTSLKARGQDPGPLIARVIYSRPQKKGREVLGGVVPYGKLWRLGANEATEIEFFVPVIINNTRVEKGRYTLYAIPQAEKWTIIVNTETDIWGETGEGKGPKYNQMNDVTRVDVPVEKLETDVEALSIGFQKMEGGAGLLIAWERAKLLLPILIAK